MENILSFEFGNIIVMIVMVVVALLVLLLIIKVLSNLVGLVWKFFAMVYNGLSVVRKVLIGVFGFMGIAMGAIWLFLRSLIKSLRGKRGYNV